MEASERIRLEKLLGMLGSAFDGERANAARMISDMAQKRKLTIVELIYGSQKSEHKPKLASTHSARQKSHSFHTATILQSLADIADDEDAYEFALTNWECQFAADVSSRYSYDYELSAKQLAIAQKIIAKAEMHRSGQ